MKDTSTRRWVKRSKSLREGTGAFFFAVLCDDNTRIHGTMAMRTSAHTLSILFVRARQRFKLEDRWAKMAASMSRRIEPPCTGAAS